MTTSVKRDDNAGDPREKGLPKWAQMLLTILRNELRNQATELAIARSEAPKSGATGKVVAESQGREGFLLHDHACIEFKLPGGSVRAMLHEEGPSNDQVVLEINGDHAIKMLPRAANSVYIVLDK